MKTHILFISRMVAFILFSGYTIQSYSQAIGDNFQSNGTGNWNSVNTWQEYYGGAWHNPANHTPTSSDGTIIIQGGHNITVTASVSIHKTTINSGGTITVNASQTLTIAAGASPELTVSGTLINSGTVTATGAISFQSGSVYQHTQDGGTIPTATWNSNSTCMINYPVDTITTAPSGLGQSFVNFTWNALVPAAGLNISGLGTVIGNFLVSLTGSNTGSTGHTLELQTAPTVSGNFTTSGNTSINLHKSSGSLTLTIGGNFNTGGNYCFASGSGATTLNISGNFNASGYSFYCNNTGSVTINIGGNFNASGNYFYSNSTGGATINLNGSGDTITQTATNFLDFSTGSTSSNATFQINSGAFYILNSNISIPGSNALTIESGGMLYTGTDIVNNNRNGEAASGGTFTNSAGGTLGIGSTQGISLAGSATGNIQTGTRIYNTGADYIYNGTANQITGTGLTQNIPANVTINNAGNIVSLSASTTISSQLILTNGGLSLNGNTFYVNNPATTAIVRDGVTYLGYIVSSSTDVSFTNIVKWNIGTTTGNHVYPFGVNASTYIPFTFNLSAGGSAGNVQVSTYPDTGTTATNVYNDRPTIVTNLASINNASTSNSNAANIVRRFWLITPSVDPITGGSATITFTYAATDVPINGVETNNMVAQHYTTSTNTWDYPFLPNQTSNTTLNTVSVPSVTNLSPWTITELANPLPVDIISYQIKCVSTGSLFTWATASETNNDYFTVEKTEDMLNWDIVTTIKGAFNSNTEIQYSSIDTNMVPDKTVYYRLKQTDFNGQYKYFDVLSILCSFNNDQLDIIGVNASNKGVNLIIKTEGLDPVQINLYDVSGRLVTQKAITSKKGANVVSLSAPDISNGIYIASILQDGKAESKKIYIGTR